LPCGLTSVRLQNSLRCRLAGCLNGCSSRVLAVGCLACHTNGLRIACASANITTSGTYPGRHPKARSPSARTLDHLDHLAPSCSPGCTSLPPSSFPCSSCGPTPW
jgi:sulfite reductase beta subunit-like hemoprotein